MTLLGGGFSLGSPPAAAAPSASVDMSLGKSNVFLLSSSLLAYDSYAISYTFLDEMIKSRRQEQQKAAKQDKKDKSVGKSRATRNAKMNAKRGLTQSSKPTSMEIRVEVQKQKSRTMQAPPPKKKGAKASEKQQASKAQKAAKTAKKNIGTMGRPPPKKAIAAAVNAMEQSGFKIPASK
jgi:hypothetical protein